MNDNDNVVAFKSRAQKANEDTVALLTDMLERARTGEIQTVAIACMCSDGQSLTSCSQGDGIQALLGALAILQHRMLNIHCIDL